MFFTLYHAGKLSIILHLVSFSFLFYGLAIKSVPFLLIGLFVFDFVVHNLDPRFGLRMIPYQFLYPVPIMPVLGKFFRWFSVQRRRGPTVSVCSQGLQGWLNSMEQGLQLLVLLFAALATGGLLVNWSGLRRAMSRLSTSSTVEFHQAANHTFDPYMAIVVVGVLLGGIVLAILFHGMHLLSGVVAVAGCVCYVAVLFKARPVTGRSLAPPGSDCTSSPLFSLPALACSILACLLAP